MITLTPILNDNSSVPLYQQLFSYIKDAIVNKDISPGDKLPSLRDLAKALNISVTTVGLAYDQLLVEGYINSKQRSGYFVNSIAPGESRNLYETGHSKEDQHVSDCFFERTPIINSYIDPACFDFLKWKTCTNRILNEYSPLLMMEGDVQGEPPLRDEISRYIYQARGVKSNLNQVVIAAGTQQLINILCIILNRMGIDHISFENPGYLPVRSIFNDRNFKMTLVPIDRDGIKIDRLPANIPSAVYVSPSNQFPTGSIMPAGRRYALLDWAYSNSSIIIEDDYNSELRYDSRPVPSLQGLDNKGQVVYLGSFSSTLFPSIKISYMVLPTELLKLFNESLSGYVQTCSKAEQLTLALYMNSGYYQTNLRRQRNLNARKIQIATDSIKEFGKGAIQILNSSSGLHMLLKTPADERSQEVVCREALNSGVLIVPASGFDVENNYRIIMFYYTRIPIKNMHRAVEQLMHVLLTPTEPEV
jgi:GntR family transcriptional regulator/MocR family aminotransferase